MAEVTFTKIITSKEVYNLVNRKLGRLAKNIELGWGRVTLQFDPPLTAEERQTLDQQFSKMGYYLLEDEENGN